MKPQNENYDIVKNFILESYKYPKLSLDCLEALVALNELAGISSITPNMISCVDVTTTKIEAQKIEKYHSI